jgi:hypothetical protein
VEEPVPCRWREVACSRLASMVAMTPNNLVRVSGFEGGVFVASHRGGRGGTDVGLAVRRQWHHLNRRADWTEKKGRRRRWR